MQLSARVHCDASAALGIVNRQGLGKLRHINVRYLWLQEKVRNKDMNVLKVPGSDNPADLFTKHLDAGTMWKHVERLGFYSKPRRSKLAPVLRNGAGEVDGNAQEGCAGDMDSSQGAAGNAPRGCAGDKTTTTERPTLASKKPVAALAPVGSPEPQGGWLEVRQTRPRVTLITPLRIKGVPPIKALTAMRSTEGEYIK